MCGGTLAGALVGVADVEFVEGAGVALGVESLAGAEFGVVVGPEGCGESDAFVVGQVACVVDAFIVGRAAGRPP